MPLPNQTHVLTYPVVLAAGASVIGVAPANPRRNYLYFQNKTVNPVTIKYGSPADSLTGFILAGGQIKEYTSMVPIGSINLSSALGTTLVILEGTPPS